jgi:hypothetical protein
MQEGEANWAAKEGHGDLWAQDGCGKRFADLVHEQRRDC